MQRPKRTLSYRPLSFWLTVTLFVIALMGSLLLLQQQVKPVEAVNDPLMALNLSTCPGGAAFATHASTSQRTPVQLPATPSDTDVRIKFEGTIQSIDDSQDPAVWVISTVSGELVVKVPLDTKIEHGPAEVGAWVKVKAHLDPTSGDIIADEIEVKRGPNTCIKVEFHGELTEIATNTWTVNGLTVVITDTTEIKGTPVVGAIVKVEGCLQTDSTGHAVVIATEVKVLRAPGEGGEEVEFRGPIVAITDTQTITDVWQVGRWTVLVIDGRTEIRGDPPDVGDLAEVHGRLNDQGQVVAEKIEVKDLGRARNLHVRIEGYITGLPSSDSNPGWTGTWRIQGIPIEVVTSTIVVGVPPAVPPDGMVWAVADVMVQQATATTQQNGVTYVAVRIRTRRSHKPADALKFQGVLESKNNDGTWTVSGWNFIVDQNTELGKNPQVNDWVEVKASVTEQNGAYTYTALEIEAKKEEGGGGHEGGHGGVKIKGRVTSMDPNTGQWAIEGIPVEVSSSTIFDERDTTIDVGTWVEVKAVVRPGQPYLALVVEAKDHAELPKGKLKFEGELGGQNSNIWVVGGWSFVVDNDTDIHGNPTIGSRVKVTATWNGSTHHADVIEAEGHHD